MSEIMPEIAIFQMAEAAFLRGIPLEEILIIRTTWGGPQLMPRALFKTVEPRAGSFAYIHDVPDGPGKVMVLYFTPHRVSLLAVPARRRSKHLPPASGLAA